MSTKGMIAIYSHPEDKLENWHCLVYKHFDSYMDGILPTLIPMLMHFDKNRGRSSIS